MDKKASLKRKLEIDYKENNLSEKEHKFLSDVFPLDLLNSLKSNEKVELIKLLLKISTVFDTSPYQMD